MTAPDIASAARHFQENLDTGDRIPELPEAWRPRTVAEGWAIQQAFAQAFRAPVAGWKIAATSKAGQAHINVDGPLPGRILGERLIPDHVTIELAPNLMRVIEAEFAFVLGEDLAPRETPYTVDEVMECVTDLCLTMEVPDSRFTDFTKVGKAQLLADNACAWWLVESPPVEADWRKVDLSQQVVKVYRNGELAATGSGANVLGDPRVALAWLVNELGALETTVCSGELVTTGTCVVPVPVAPEDEMIADFGELGSLRVHFG